MIELFTLGSVDVRAASATGASVRRLLSQPKAFALFVYLAAHESFVRRDLLAALFWPELDERRARNLLSKTLRRVTDAAGAHVLETRGLSEIHVPAEHVWCDARELERHAAAGGHSAALDLFRGEFLDGWHLAGLSEFSHWLETMRHRLRHAAVEAARHVAADRTALGDFDRAIEALRRARALAPASEIVTRELMTLLDRRGDAAAALELFNEASSWLAREIGTGPSAPTRLLAEAMRAPARTPVEDRPAPLPDAGSTSTTPMVTGLALAVLPLDNLTGDPAQRYFVDGMTDALITQLARLGPGRVISRQSTLRYRESQLPAREIARELGVDLLLGGSVARAGERVRITVQLIRADRERHLWAGAYERTLRDILDLQAEVTHAIAGEVARAAGADSPEPPADAPAALVTPAAYEAYLKGRFFSAMLPDLPKAIACFREAAALDPGYVPAWAGLAMAYANLAMFVYLPPDAALPEVARAAGAALALDPDSGEAHMARGLARLLGDWDWTGARHDFSRAVSLAPGAVEPRVYRAIFRSAMGEHDQAIEDARAAMAIDPLGPGTRFSVALCHYKARHYDASIRALEGALELYPHFVLALPLVAANHALAGRPHDAVRAAKLSLVHLPDDQQSLAYAAAALGLAGERGEARQALERLRSLERRQYVDPWAIAVACCGLGETDDAIASLGRLRERRSPSAFCVRTEPMFAALGPRPEYRALLQELAMV